MTKDVALARKRRRFTCAMLVLLPFMGVVLFCTAQLHSVGTLVLEARPGETIDGEIGTPFFASYLLRFGNETITRDEVKLNLDSGGPVELECLHNQFQVRRVMQIPRVTFKYEQGNYIRLVNLCDVPMLLKVCWFDDFFLRILFYPACEI